jgi:hypothetical protein
VPARSPGKLDLHFSSRHFFFDEDFLGGTLAPAFRASYNPIAMACLRLFTFFPDRPLLSFPVFRSCIAFSTFSAAFFPYLAILFILLQNRALGEQWISTISKAYSHFDLV